MKTFVPNDNEKVLLLDDDKGLGETMVDMLDSADIRSVWAGTVSEARDYLESTPPLPSWWWTTISLMATGPLLRSSPHFVTPTPK